MKQKNRSKNNSWYYLYKWDDLSRVMRTNTISQVNDRIGKQSAYMYLDRKVKKLVGKNGERYLLMEVGTENHYSACFDDMVQAARQKMWELLAETSMGEVEVKKMFEALVNTHSSTSFKKMVGCKKKDVDWWTLENEGGEV